MPVFLFVRARVQVWRRNRPQAPRRPARWMKGIDVGKWTRGTSGETGFGRESTRGLPPRTLLRDVGGTGAGLEARFGQANLEFVGLAVEDLGREAEDVLAVQFLDDSRERRIQLG